MYYEAVTDPFSCRCHLLEKANTKLTVLSDEDLRVQNWNEDHDEAEDVLQYAGLYGKF